MKAIIMASGIGSRLQQINENRPKCLIEKEGMPLIERSVKLLNHRGITDISVITGYKSELIHQVLGTRVNYFHNPYFQVTNSIASLWLARELLCDDVILMNADLYYEEEVLDTILSETGSAVMLSDLTRIEDADFRFCVRGDRILKTGNKLSANDADCEYVGIVRIDKSFIAPFKKRLEQMIASGDFRNWWEGVSIFMLSTALVLDALLPMLWIFAGSQVLIGLARSLQRARQLQLDQHPQILTTTEK